jgi:hypothetical protein
VKGRRTRSLCFIALGLVLALVAAACGDDGNDTADAPADETTEAPEAPDGDGDGEDSGEPLATTATIGDDGRLVPGPCPEGEATDSDPEHGVFADRVDVGMVTIDFGPLADLGFAASDTNVLDFATPYIDAVNEAGGVCGRTIDFQGVDYDIIAQEGPQACVEVTEDRTNLIVLAQGGFNEALCIADAGTLVYSQQDFADESIEGTEGLMFVRAPSVDDQYEASVRYFHDQGLLDGKVGVWYGAVFLEQGDAVEERILPLLDDLEVDYEAFRTNEIGPTSEEGGAIIRSAAASFAQENVDTVLNFTQTTNHVGMQSELDALGVTPTWLSAPIGMNTANDLFAEAFGVTEIADGEQIVTYFDTTPGFDTEAARSCNEEFTAATGIEYEEASFDWRGVANICNQIDMLVAALTEASPDVTQESLADAIEALPPHPMGAQLGLQHFGAGGRTGADTFAVLTYDGAANTYDFEGDEFTLDEVLE